MDSQPQHRIEQHPAFTIIGLAVDCPDFNVEPIGQLWHDFIHRRGELPATDGLYGISLPLPGFGVGFRYFACAIVPEDTPVPDGMERLKLPATSFLVREFHDTMDKLGPLWSELYRETLPAAGLASSEPFICMEHYADDWMGDDGRARLTMYAGVKQA